MRSLSLGLAMVAVIVLVFSCGPDGFAQQATGEQGGVAKASGAGGPAKKITRSYTNHSLTMVLKDLKSATGVNIVADATITEKDLVTADFTDLDWETALEEVLRLTGCTMELVKGVIRVTKPPRVNAEFNNAPLNEVIKVLASQAGASVVIAPEITKATTITMKFKDVPFKDALNSLVKTAGYAMVEEPYSILRVVTPDKLVSQMETRMFQFKHVRPPDIYIPKIKTEYAIGTPLEIKDPLKEFTLLDALRNMLTKDSKGKSLGSLQYDKITNTVIATDTKPILDAMGKMIDRMDVEPLQVLIEVRYVSTTNTALRDIGLFYGNEANGGIEISTQAGFFPGVIGTPPPATPHDTATRFPFGFGNDYTGTQTAFINDLSQLTATLRLFKRDTSSRLVQVPTIVALDNQDATIFVGETIHYAETTAVASQSGGLEYSIKEAANSPVTVGFQLLVIPHIVRGTDKIMLTVIPQDETLTGTSAAAAVAGFERFTIGSGGNQQVIDLPRKRSSTIVTKMILESGQTAVVGGLARDQRRQTTRKVPFLGDLPVLEYLFTEKSKNVATEHLLVFVTPRIVRSSKDSREALASEFAGRGDGILNTLDGGRKKVEGSEKTVEEARREIEQAEEFERIKRGDVK
jgi:type IV pilus assembly protein PilQ